MVDMRKGPIGKDSYGYDAINQAVKVMLNQFPGLNPGEEVKFEEIGNEEGFTFVDDSGALVYTEKKSITGVIYQDCRYPFLFVFRLRSSKERQKLVAHQFLDVLGKWICQEPTIYEHSQPPLEYPKLTGGRKITRVIRDNIYSQEPQENGLQDWVLPITIEYTNKFRKAR